MASTRRTWLWIIFGVLICIALGGVALVGGGIYMVSKHVKTELVGRTSAARNSSSGSASGSPASSR